MSKQKGFTLLELLVALLISSVLLTGTIYTFYQLQVGANRASSQMIADSDINKASSTILRDLMMTQTTDLIDGDPEPQSSVTLGWIDYTGFESANETHHSVSYSSNGTALWRTYDGYPSIVGRDITYLGFKLKDGMIKVNITATGTGVQERSEALEFSVKMRAEAIE